MLHTAILLYGLFNPEVVSSNLTVLQIMWGIAQMDRAPLFSKTVAIYIRYMQQSF